MEHSLNDSIRTFWESEEISITPTPSPQDDFVEFLFRTTTYRTETGRYGARLPFKNGKAPDLTFTRDIAYARMLKLEMRFKRDTVFFKYTLKILKSIFLKVNW